MQINKKGVSLIVLIIIIIIIVFLAGIAVTYVVRDDGVVSTAIKMELDTDKAKIRDILWSNIKKELLSSSSEIEGTSSDISTKFNEIRLINFLAGHNNYVDTDHDDSFAILCIEKLGTDSNDNNNAKVIIPRGGNVTELSTENYEDLIAKELVTSDNAIYNLYRIIPEALSSDTSYGKGKKISDGDIFVLEAVDEEGNRIPENGNSTGQYCLKYYDKEGNVTILDTIPLYTNNQS